MRVFKVIMILFLQSAGVSALPDSGLCYILDGILVLYGIVLTVLYCRLRMQSSGGKKPSSDQKEEGIYKELNRPTNDTYDILQPKK
ncbi:Fc receptor, IgE, high affinity I, gamma polypeptide like [Denticeps clupeoides]|uniref:Fc receptor gamma-chain n=1 Tax=Denticeps clupeoides TaxID=299321 RepID=A0AAY4BNU9_9TELE|nr:high affinity immunoglobulin epsilon receptor subunit gamma-like [Denticeps clupeoides]XP_028832860.1 high affinity immunoglobulin epsilon receptor subunit gamma-like [Denticeps clupeoides]